MFNLFKKADPKIAIAIYNPTCKLIEIRIYNDRNRLMSGNDYNWRSWLTYSPGEFFWGDYFNSMKEYDKYVKDMAESIFKDWNSGRPTTMARAISVPEALKLIYRLRRNLEGDHPHQDFYKLFNEDAASQEAAKRGINFAAKALAKKVGNMPAYII